jgi:hypothetical protein
MTPPPSSCVHFRRALSALPTALRLHCKSLTFQLRRLLFALLNRASWALPARWSSLVRARGVALRRQLPSSGGPQEWAQPVAPARPPRAGLLCPHWTRRRRAACEAASESGRLKEGVAARALCFFAPGFLFECCLLCPSGGARTACSLLLHCTPVCRLCATRLLHGPGLEHTRKVDLQCSLWALWQGITHGWSTAAVASQHAHTTRN